MWKIILLIAALILCYAGCNKVMTKSTPVICSVEDAEKKDLSNYDYFQLSKGYVSGIGYYEYNQGSTDVNEFVYGLISEKLIDEYLETYQKTHSELDSFASWFSENVKPKIFIRSSKKNISKNRSQTGNYDYENHNYSVKCKQGVISLSRHNRFARCRLLDLHQ